jgi:hypothetical protein
MAVSGITAECCLEILGAGMAHQAVQRAEIDRFALIEDGIDAVGFQHLLALVGLWISVIEQYIRFRAAHVSSSLVLLFIFDWTKVDGRRAICSSYLGFYVFKEHVIEQCFYIVGCHGSHPHAELITYILSYVIIMHAKQPLILWVQVSDFLHCSWSFLPDCMIDLRAGDGPQHHGSKGVIG